MSETKNELEDLLEKAATEPAHRPAFFRTLLESTVWVPGTAAQGEAVVEDSALDLQHWEKEDGTSVIPFFTSLEALQQVVEDEQAFVVMPVRTLFEMTLGETLFLNAKLPTGKEFMPREISLLIGEPWLYFVFEVVVMTSLFVYMRHCHEAICARLYHKYITK